MSFVTDLAFNDQQALEQDALANPAITPPEPSFWDGSGTALFSGIAQGATQLALQAAQYGNDPDQAILFDVPTDEEEIARRAAIGQQRLDVTERLRPDAQTSGTAAQILFGLGDAGTRFAFGAASGGLPIAATGVGASMGEQRFSELRAQGVDPKTAALAGAVEGGTMAAGAFLPAARLLSQPVADLAATAGANVALGAVSRGGIGQVLESNGYTQQAQQYKALDGQAMAIDGLLGSAFWGLGRALSGAPAASPETIDAALAANNGVHAQHGTAPGAPVDARSSAAHQGALDLALEQMSRGEPVNVTGLMDDTAFIRSNRVGPDEAVVRDQAQQEVFAGARAELEPVAATALPNVRDIRAEVTGLRRNLDELDQAHEAAGNTYRQAAKEFQQQRMSRKQAERAARDSIAQQRQAIDEQRSSTQARIDELNQQLEGNRAAERARTELAAMDRGETPARLQSQVDQRAEQIGSAFKRSALASSVAPDHGMALNRLAAEDIQRMLRESGQLIEEPTAPAAPRTPETDSAPTAQTQQLRAAQPVQQAETSGSAPAAPETEAAQTGTAVAESATPAMESVTAGAQSADAVAGIDPALPALLDAVAAGERDLQVPTGAINEDGTPVTVSARELLAEADAEIAQAANDSKGFLAAALCALRFGN
ncbi:hypothetical protein [Pseudomonas putida]|uniref:hypothetical protein n=1 Tax=Pseudomonas putida TaxID=303 RepID=UPI0018D6A127|nr:hypothetical protein [Pseudomonas putida]MBH3412523.1 hypothetical protein [Pseudomonas putida]